jgi:hypothetical protein
VSTEPADENSIVKDGLSGSTQPLPREPGAPPEADADTENDSAPDVTNNSAARDDVEGLNKAVGPAEESDDRVEDGRALTTDISPSD